MHYINHYNSPLGKITFASNGKELTGLWFDGQKYFASTLTKEYEQKNLPVFEQTAKWLDIYFIGKNPDFTPPLFLSSTSFRNEVWKILLTIPYGKIMTYGEIAKLMAENRGVEKCLHSLWVAQWDITYFNHCSVPQGSRYGRKFDRLCGRC